MVKWLIAGAVSFLLTFVWTLCKAASDADDAIEAESIRAEHCFASFNDFTEAP